MRKDYFESQLSKNAKIYSNRGAQFLCICATDAVYAGTKAGVTMGLMDMNIGCDKLHIYLLLQRALPLIVMSGN